MVGIDLNDIDSIDELRSDFEEDLEEDEPFEEWAMRMLDEEVERVGRNEDKPVEDWAEVILRRDIREYTTLVNCDVLRRPRR